MMTSTDFDREFIRFILKFSEDRFIDAGFHMNAAGWIAWVKHVAEGAGKHVDNIDALLRLEKLLDDKNTNPYRPGIGDQWEYKVIDLQLDRRTGPPFKQKVEEATRRLKELFAGNGVTLLPLDWDMIQAQFRIRILEMAAIQMALGDGKYHVQDAAARAFRKMWSDNDWDMQKHLPSPSQAWPPVFDLEES